MQFKYGIGALSILLLFLLIQAFQYSPQSPVITEEDALSEVLLQLGDDASTHLLDESIAGVSATKGKDLIFTGFALSPKGKKTSKQSSHFVCTSCHNVERDEPDLSKVDPVAKLDFVETQGLPFLQGTALYGAVNRTSFYNEDYYKKYGDLVKPARNDIREAIQLCAVECAQGRRLDAWEVESILAYLWTIELKLKDLNLTTAEMQQINEAIANEQKDTSIINLLKSKYLAYSPATFNKPPEDRKAGYGLQGDPANGKRIYDLSCMHCHEEMRYSQFELDNAKYTFQFLEKHIPKYTRYSIYQVGRYGTSPKPGKRAYMPQYTEEKMNNQQMEDLRAYILTMAE